MAPALLRQGSGGVRSPGLCSTASAGDGHLRNYAVLLDLDLLITISILAIVYMNTGIQLHKYPFLVSRVKYTESLTN